MPIVLLRVDERLIHGQVVVGWGERLHIERIMVVDEELANSLWEQELYTLGLPSGVSAEFVDVAAARDKWREWKNAAARTVVLLRDIRTLAALGDTGVLDGEEVNLGGIHHAAGRERVLPYLFLSPAEKRELRGVAAAGARVTARDLPTVRRVSLDELIPEE